MAGKVAMAAGRRDEAHAHFRRALTVDPQNSSAINDLGRLALAGRGPRGGATLANAANAFAHAVRTDPAASTSRSNLDVVIRSFLAKLSYALLLAAFVVSRAVGRNPAAWTRIVPLLLLAAPASVLWRFFSRATPVVRRLVVGECLRRPLFLPVMLGAVSALSVIASAMAPQSSRDAFVVTAAGMALLCRYTLVLRLNQSVQTAATGSPQPMLGTAALWCVVVALLFTALLLLMAATSGGGGGLRVGIAAAVPALIALLMVRAARKRAR